MIPINSAIGVLVFLVGLALVAAIAVNLHTQHLLKRCISIIITINEWVISNNTLIETLQDEIEREYRHEGTD